MKRRDVDRLTSDAWLIRRDYDDLWASFVERLPESETSAAPLGSGRGNVRRGVGAVLRLTGGVASSLEGAARTLAGLVDEETIPFGAPDLHTTVHALEARGGEDVDEAAARRFAETVLDVAPRYDRLCVRYEGLTAGPTGILAQGWPVGEGLRDLRREVARRLDARDLPAAVGPGRVRRTAHATLVTFVEPLRDPARLADFVGSNRGTVYGTANFSSMDVIRYDFVGSRAELIPLARIPLGGRGTQSADGGTPGIRDEPKRNR